MSSQTSPVSVRASVPDQESNVTKSSQISPAFTGDAADQGYFSKELAMALMNINDDKEVKNRKPPTPGATLLTVLGVVSGPANVARSPAEPTLADSITEVIPTWVMTEVDLDGIVGLFQAVYSFRDYELYQRVADDIRGQLIRGNGGPSAFDKLAQADEMIAARSHDFDIEYKLANFFNHNLVEQDLVQSLLVTSSLPCLAFGWKFMLSGSKETGDRFSGVVSLFDHVVEEGMEVKPEHRPYMAALQNCHNLSRLGLTIGNIQDVLNAEGVPVRVKTKFMLALICTKEFGLADLEAADFVAECRAESLNQVAVQLLCTTESMCSSLRHHVIELAAVWTGRDYDAILASLNHHERIDRKIFSAVSPFCDEFSFE